MILSVHQPHYMPWLGYLDKIARSDAFVFLDDVQYKEREFQNRNKIRTSSGWMWLTVPVETAGRGRQRFRDVRIDGSTGWRAAHWKSLRTWYAKAPGFKAHENFFSALYGRPWDFLWELNVHLTRYLLGQAGIVTRIHFESDVHTTKTKTGRILELCARLGADTYLSGSGARAYLDEPLFSAAGIKLVYQSFEHPVYNQQFVCGSSPFIPYMAAIDMLFNEESKYLNINNLQSCANNRSCVELTSAAP